MLKPGFGRREGQWSQPAVSSFMRIPDAKLRSGYQEESLQDSMGREALERVKDAEDGFEAGDWGLGSAPRPPMA